MNKILIIPDSFKETIPAIEVANVVKKEFVEVYPNCEIVTLAMADGGEGTVDTLVAATKGTRIKVEVVDPLLRRIETYIGLNHAKTCAFIEMAKASGIELITENEKTPLNTSSYGTGQMILKALDLGVTDIVIGIGGSATNEAGFGMLEALGARFYDANNGLISKIMGNKLAKIVKIDTTRLDPRIFRTNILIASDVTNVFYGQSGASYVFGPQKGANKATVELLDAEFKRLNQLFINEFKVNLNSMPGSGAAGGMGGILKLFCNAHLKSGVNIVADILNLDAIIQTCDLVITGEGRIDGQTCSGKAPYGVAMIAQKYQVPVIAICGSLNQEATKLYDHGFNAIYSIMLKPQTFPEAKKDTEVNLRLTVKAIANTLKIVNN